MTRKIIKTGPYPYGHCIQLSSVRIHPLLLFGSAKPNPYKISMRIINQIYYFFIFFFCKRPKRRGIHSCYHCTRILPNHCSFHILQSLLRCAIKKMSVFLFGGASKQCCHQIRPCHSLGILKSFYPAVFGQWRPVWKCHCRTVLYCSITFIFIRHHCCVYVGHTDILSSKFLKMSVKQCQRMRHIRHIDICL